MNRPTLEEQIDWKEKVDSMTDAEIMDYFSCRHDLIGRIDLWAYYHLHLVWSVVHWNWFCIFCGKRHFRISERKCEREYNRRRTWNGN